MGVGLPEGHVIGRRKITFFSANYIFLQYMLHFLLGVTMHMS